MKLFEPIRFHDRLRDVRLSSGAAPADWLEQLAAAERAGYQKGLIEGEKALNDQLLQQRAELIAMHGGPIAALEAALPQLVERYQEDLIALASDVAQKLVAGMPISRDLVAAAVADALQHVEDTGEVTVLLHAEDLALLTSRETTIDGSPRAGERAFSPRITFAASSRVSPGGCVVETRFGTIDGRRETRLARITEALGMP